MRQGCRYALRLTLCGPDLTSRAIRWREDAAYLITGGFGGVGLEIARAMATAGARRLILLGRTALPPREQWSGAPLDSRLGSPHRRRARARGDGRRGAHARRRCQRRGRSARVSGSLRGRRLAADPRRHPRRRSLRQPARRRDDASRLRRLSLSRSCAAHSCSIACCPTSISSCCFSSVGAFLPLPGGSNYAAANAGLDALAAGPPGARTPGPEHRMGHLAGHRPCRRRGRSGQRRRTGASGRTELRGRSRRAAVLLRCAAAPGPRLRRSRWTGSKFGRARAGRVAPLFRDCVG